MLPIIIVKILISSLIAIVCIWFKRNFSYWSNYKQIPSVKGRIFSGNFIDFLTFKTNFGYHLKTIYGDRKFQNEAVVGVYGLYKPALLIREPKLLKSIFIKDFDYFRNRACLADDQNDPMGALNMFFAKNSYWKEIRMKLGSVFSSGKLKYMYPLINKVGEQLENYLNKHGDRYVHELKELCGRYTTDNISTTIMGCSSNALNNSQEYIYLETVKLADFNFKRALQILVAFFAPKFNRILKTKMFYPSTEKFMRSSIKYAMEERERMGNTRNDVIDAFVKIKQEAESKGEDVSKCIEGLIAQACILMMGGFDTSTGIISRALLELAKDQKVQHKLREEILQVGLTEKGQISYESLNKMKYLQMVIDETIRIHPVLPLLERMYELPTNKSNDFSLRPYYDFDLPSGMAVYITLLGLHHDPKYWPNPEKFDPERFSPANKELITPMSYIPFGEGPRGCIASRLGLLQIKVGLIHFLRNHYVQVCDKTILQPEYEPKAIVLQTKGGTYVEIVRDNLYKNGIEK